jgi:hypothetical protein
VAWPQIGALGTLEDLNGAAHATFAQSFREARSPLSAMEYPEDP